MIKDSIVSSEPHGLGPQPVTDDAPAVCLDVKLSEPPNYKVGDKVGFCKACMLPPHPHPPPIQRD